MAKSQSTEAVKKLDAVEHALDEATPVAVLESMLLSAQQRSAVIAGLAIAQQGVVKATLGLKGEYISPRRKPKASAT